MGAITKKDLSIFRGTYEEIKNLPTEDMRIYLSWDTQEIFVGNSIGTKVPYGVPKILFNKIDRDLKSIEERLNEKYDVQVDILVQQHLREFLDSSEFSDSVKSEIERLFNNFIASIESNINRLDKEITEINNKIKSNKEDTDKRISDIKIPTKVSELENDSNYLTKHQSLDNYYTKQDVDSEIKKATENIDLTEYYTKTQIDKKLEEISAGDIDLSRYYNKEETESKIDEKINPIISEINNRYSNEDIDAKIKNNLSEYYKKTDGNLIKNATGIQMIDNKWNNMDIVLCTEKISNGDILYKENTMYYYSIKDNKFHSLASGGSGKEKITANLILKQIPGLESECEINSQPIVLDIGAINGKITNKNAIKSYEFTLNGKPISSSSISDNASDSMSITNKSQVSINISTEGRNEIKFSAEKKQDTEEFEYSLIGSPASRSFNVYIPIYYGNDNNLIKGKLSTELTKLSALVEPGKPFYVYTTKDIVILFGISEGEFDTIENVEKEVNGVNINYKKYGINTVNAENKNFEITIKEK